ncbi:MAG: peptide chain release factor N(5)-glutamine methyltransferase [Candidatus Uhrbacteria bacterium]|nr:peptide chain release factor N(5)-glutamine methyltransferase [Candidatus Uhrbacteria bacterium]
MTIMEALNWGREQLKKTETEKHFGKSNTMLDAQVLLAFCINKPTAFLFTHFDDPISDGSLQKFQDLINQRSKHEPVAYLTGEKEFYNRAFKVNPSVLIPRPDTEAMIEIIKEIARPESVILDIGTGSGAIAVTLAAELSLPLVAIDISEAALEVARSNAERHKVEYLISFLNGNLLEPFFESNVKVSNDKHAIICANLPYIRIANWQYLDPDVKDFEPRSALIGGVDGLEFYRELMRQIHEHRNIFPIETDVILEIDPSQELGAPSMIREYFPNAQIKIERDLSGKSRVVVVRI